MGAVEEPVVERYPSLEPLNLEETLMKSSSKESTEKLLSCLTAETRENRERDRECLRSSLPSLSMNRPRQVEVWSTQAGKISMLAPLQGENLASVCSIVDIHPQTNLVVGGNSSGRLHVFM